MNKPHLGLFLSLLLLLGMSACGEKESTSKLILNEVLIDNQSNFQDDYGVHSAWIEIFNTSYGSADLAACLLRVSSQPGDTATYFIPKGDVLTVVKPRQHALFWADGRPNRGTFHTNFTLHPSRSNWIGLYDSGRKLLDSVEVPAGILSADQSYARVSDGTAQWEVKGGSADKYVTPSTNNRTIDSNAKMEKFEEHDSTGVGMALSAMSVVFCGLILLFLSFKIVGKIAVQMGIQRKAMSQEVKKAQEVARFQTGASQGAPSPQGGASQVSDEVYAAIAMALHDMQNLHDIENTVLTIKRQPGSYSPWSSKINTLRVTPNRK